LGYSTPSTSAGAAGAGVLVSLIHASANLASFRSLLSFHGTVGAIFTSVTCALYWANEPVFEWPSRAKAVAAAVLVLALGRPLSGSHLSTIWTSG